MDDFQNKMSSSTPPSLLSNSDSESKVQEKELESRVLKGLRGTKLDRSSPSSSRDDEWDPQDEDEFEEDEEEEEERSEEHYNCDENSTDYENDDIVQQHAEAEIHVRNFNSHNIILILDRDEPNRVV